MNSKMKAVIIGGGIAGVALSRNLAKAGVAVTVIERGPQLCSGATWHAAGLVTRFAGSPKLKKVRDAQTPSRPSLAHAPGYY